MTKHALPITRADNFPDWYQEVIKGADMAENSGVRGCMVIKPWGYGMWERIQRLLDDKIKATGHENCYFPLFIPLDLFEKEAKHIEGFAKEMAVVTHHRLEEKDGKLQLAGELETPLVVRPTSETVISEAFSRWISSYRDLPVKINQWANVVRWEMRTRMFLRTAEFLWQEGHTAHETREEAEEETLQMLHVYRELAEDELCMPVILGRKSPGERFPGAVETYTFEAMMQDGKALQAGTSHYLGETFARAADIRFNGRDGEMHYAHSTSWGTTTRLVGALIMTHGDDDGMRVPPRIAPHQIVFIPMMKDESKVDEIIAYCKELKTQLEAQTFAGEKIRAHVDMPKGETRGRYWDWVRKGAPIICEVGPRDLENGTLAMAQRHLIHEKKRIVSTADLLDNIQALLGGYEKALWEQATTFRDNNIHTGIQTFDQLKAHFENNENPGFVKAKWCEDEATEDMLKEFKVTIRCLPLEQSGTEGKCVLTGKPATVDAIFAKSY